MTIEKWLSDVYYDKNGGTYLWNEDGNGGFEMVAQVRGWGALQYKFKTYDEAKEFQKQVGDFIAEAIREKVARDFGKKSEKPINLEISNEEIDKASNYFYPLLGEQSKKAIWVNGCKWYREKLKSKQ